MSNDQIDIIDINGKNILCFDLETTGLPILGKQFATHTNCQYYLPTDNSKYNASRIVQIAWSYIEDFTPDKLDLVTHDMNGKNDVTSYIRKPKDFIIPNESSKIHGITNCIALTEGFLISDILNNKGFRNAILQCDVIIGHNILFDIYILMNELHRIKHIGVYNKLQQILDSNMFICTLKIARSLKHQLKLGQTNLGAVYTALYGDAPQNLHNAKIDVEITLKIFKKLYEYVNSNAKPIQTDNNGDKNSDKNNIDYYVYTDGACLNNGKPNAIAGIGIYFGTNDARNVSARVVGKQSNNVAELDAIFQTFSIIENDLASGKRIGIVSDSIYALKCVCKYGELHHIDGWSKPIPNVDLVKKTYLTYLNANVKFIHIKAHTTNTDTHSIGNDGADKLANKAIGFDTCPYAVENRIYLNVPFKQKDKIKQMGANWDNDIKKWYVVGSTIGFEQYL